MQQVCFAVLGSVAALCIAMQQVCCATSVLCITVQQVWCAKLLCSAACVCSAMQLCSPAHSAVNVLCSLCTSDICSCLLKSDASPAQLVTAWLAANRPTLSATNSAANLCDAKLHYLCGLLVYPAAGKLAPWSLSATHVQALLC